MGAEGGDATDSLTFRDTKNGLDHTAPLAPAVKAMFNRRPKQPEDFVFPSPRERRKRHPGTAFRGCSDGKADLKK